jgi:hypothetical protein
MGQNGEQLVKADGTFGIHSDAKRILFDSTNTTCCCGDEPPDPPTGKPCPDVFNFGDIRLPNTAKVSLGYSWSAVDAIATRQDNIRTFIGRDPIFSTSIYWVTIGAVKTGDQAYGTRTVVSEDPETKTLRTSNWSDFANDINTLKDGKTYYLGIMISFNPDQTLNAEVHLLPYRNNPTVGFYPRFHANFHWRPPIYYAKERQDWKNPNHPAGFYDFTFSTDRSTLARNTRLGFNSSDDSELIQHDMSMFAFTFDLGNSTSDTNTPAGGTLVFRDDPCRKPYHAASGANAYASSQSSGGMSRLEEPWMYFDLQGVQLAHGQECFPKNTIHTPPEFCEHIYSDVGFSGFKTKQWNIPYTNRDSDGNIYSSVFPYQYSGSKATLVVPYDLRATYTAEFTVRPFHFKYNKVYPDNFNYWMPEEIRDRSVGTFSTNLTGCNGIGLQSFRSFRFDSLGNAQWQSRFAVGENALGDGLGIFEPINTYPDEFDVGGYGGLAKQGETTIRLVYTFNRYVGDSNGHREVWNIEVFADGIYLGVLERESSQAFGSDTFASGTNGTVHNRVPFVFSGDNINSLNPRATMPTLTFEPLNSTQPNLATNSNQPFNQGLLNFSLTHNAELFDSGFKGDVKPYTPIFDYPPEGIGNSHWNLIKGRSYTFRIIDQFQMTDLQGFFCNDNMLPIGMTLDQSTGTISGTPEGNDSGTIIIHGTDAFDRTYNRSFDFRVDNGTTETPQT